MGEKDLILHASCVDLGGAAVLIVGPSGSGKSGLALQLIALGARLVADDRTILQRNGDALVACVPDAIAGLIEARGVGLLSVPHSTLARVALVIDLAVLETARLPHPRSMTILDITLPCLHKVDAPYFPAAIHAYINGIRNEAR